MVDKAQALPLGVLGAEEGWELLPMGQLPVAAVAAPGPHLLTQVEQAVLD